VKRIESILKREIGLCPQSIGANAVRAAVKLRMAACRLNALDDYATRLEREWDERRALVEEIVVSETWFFRDEEVFRMLSRHAASAVRERRKLEPLRVLSMPCATGEEAYSVAIVLLEAGLAPAKFEVHGLDISERALTIAQCGVYGKNSFRGVNSAERRRYFEPVGEELRVADLARQQVSFARGNVLAEQPAWGRGSFDVILCRNLLIYLDQEARSRALDNLLRWLANDGVLFAGHAEALETMDARFQKLPGTSHFAYVKRATERTRVVPQNPLARPPVQAPKSPVGGVKVAPVKPKLEVANLAPPAQPSLEHAHELADRGELSAAAATCERYIREVGACAQAYWLLGTVRSANAESELALACFNRVLYLDPAHCEAMIQLALLHEQRGELEVAKNFRRRAEHARRKRAAP
jgi:chemotaxis protein methyltransferase WspC